MTDFLPATLKKNLVHSSNVFQLDIFCFPCLSAEETCDSESKCVQIRLTDVSMRSQTGWIQEGPKEEVCYGESLVCRLFANQCLKMTQNCKLKNKYIKEKHR